MSKNDPVTDDLYSGFNFLLEVESMDNNERHIIAGFTSVKGGGIKVERRDTTHGDTPYKTHEPGQVEYENLVLTRGMTENTDLLDWMYNVAEGKKDMRAGSVVMLNNDGEEVRRYNFYDAYPCKWGGPDLNAESSAVAIESFELAFSHMDWEQR